MSVALRLILSLSTLVACTALLGVAALSGLAALGDRYRLAEDQYRDLRALYEIAFHAASVRTLLNAQDPDPRQIEQHLRVAADSARVLPRSNSAPGDAQPPGLADARRSLDDQLQSAAASFNSNQSLDHLRADTNRWLAGVAALLPGLEDAIVANREKALAEHRTTLAILAVVVAASAFLALAAGIFLYRSIMRSLRALEHAAANFTRGNLAYQTPDAGDREFRRLARAFNHMGRTIDQLHSSMRAQVEAKSMALIRSERLAGLGVLAAGIAHEINNPLAIIAGHAQMTLRQIRAERRKPPESSAPAPLDSNTSDHAPLSACRETLTIITEETFRCRDIVRQFLALTHPAEDHPQFLDLATIARKAISLVSPLPLAKDKHLSFGYAHADAAPPVLPCRGHPPQLLQVLINLLTNALEASPPGGRIEVSLDHTPSAAILSVRDNGIGMDAHTLAHAFDPFFTDKPRRGLPGPGTPPLRGGLPDTPTLRGGSSESTETPISGAGLGLFVSHSIIQRHGGRLLAHSDGPGAGSVFVIELPLAAIHDSPARSQEPTYVAAA